jgi:hypothetical protein
MGTRAVEFVETWVSEKVEAMDMNAPVSGDEAQAKQLAAACISAAANEGIPSSEIDEVFDDLAAFIEGEIGEARDREADEDDDEDDASLIDDDDARLDMEDDDDEEDAEDKGGENKH